MHSFAVLLLCIQACLVQNVLSQCSCGGLGLASLAPAATTSGYGYGGASVAGLEYGLGNAGVIGYAGGIAHGAASTATYGGVGEGNIGVIGELPVSGNTAVIGQVPILGAVNFCGDVPAAGSVVINGQCTCGCDY